MMVPKSLELEQEHQVHLLWDEWLWELNSDGFSLFASFRDNPILNPAEETE